LPEAYRGVTVFVTGFSRIDPRETGNTMRKPKLRRKQVGKHSYWYTEANGGAYFGKVGEVSYGAARNLFADHLKKNQAPADPGAGVLTVGELFSSFLTWVQENRSDAQYRRRKRDCSRFGRFVFQGRRLADIPALEVTGAMLEAWRANLKESRAEGAEDVNARDKRGLDPQSVLHAETSIRHAFNWATRHNSPSPLVPATFRPFSGVERTKVPSAALSEADLLTEIEVAALLAATRFDVDQFRRWGIERHIQKHGSAKMRPCKDNFGDMLAVYYATGARTSELAVAQVRDFSTRSRQIVLKEHKRSRTQAVASVRHINVSGEALGILQRLCAGRQPDELIFARPWGKPWTKKTLNTRLHAVRRIAVALGTKVRETVTIYDFRHLWISEALMAGVDVMTVARMAGTSVRMIETVYGHFRTDHYADAQRRLEEARQARRTVASQARKPNRGQGAHTSSARPDRGGGG
jgi:integrase